MKTSTEATVVHTLFRAWSFSTLVLASNLKKRYSPAIQTRAVNAKQQDSTQDERDSQNSGRRTSSMGLLMKIAMSMYVIKKAPLFGRYVHLCN